MIVSGYVPTDYSDIVTGINALIASGVASGAIDEFYLYVDDSYYTGVFSASVPNSGSFYIIGSGTNFAPQDTCTIYTEGDGVFSFEDVSLIGEDTSNFLLNVSGSSTLQLKESSMCAAAYGISAPSGTVLISDSHLGGSGVGMCISGNQVNIQDSDISQFAVGVYTSSSEINDSHFVDCTTTVQLPVSGYTYIDRTLIHGGSVGVQRAVGSSTTVRDSTIEAVTPINGSGGVINLSNSILDAAVRCINGALASGSYVIDCGLYPSGWSAADVVIEPSGINLKYDTPLFNQPSIGDYRLKYDYVNGSPYVEHVSKNVPSGVTLRTEISNITFSDTQGTVDDLEAHKFIYKQGNTLHFSDYNKEVEFAYYMNTHPNLEYFASTQAKFDVYEQNLQSCFAQDGNHPQPFDWDLKTFESVEIVSDPSDLQYVIPRSYIDLEPIVESKVGTIGTEFRFDKMSKANIKVYNKEEIRGIAFDFDLSDPGSPMAWRVNGRNQLLEKINVFTGEPLEIYPLFCPDLGEDNVTQVKGLVYIGPRDDKFRFTDITNPAKEYIGETQQAHFKWIDTTINPQVDARGILAYKNNLFITGTRYSRDVYDRTSVPTLDSSGVTPGTLVRYYNSHKFSHYTTAFDSLGARRMSLDKNNALPTDITIYEDGNLLIADYANYSGLYRYKFAHDYAILEEEYNKLSRVLLREFYPSINF
jgi:hypothetical protein